MEDVYTKKIEYLIVVTSTLRLEFNGEPVAFDTAAEAEDAANSHRGKRRPEDTCAFGDGYSVFKKETSYVCAAADDFWDEVDCETTFVKEVVKHDPQV